MLELQGPEFGGPSQDYAQPEGPKALCFLAGFEKILEFVVFLQEKKKRKSV